MANVQLVCNPPWAAAGYAVQCAQLARQLRKHGHNVLIQADTMPFGAVLTWEGIPVAPGFTAGAAPHDMTGYYAMHHESDLVIVLLDVFGLNAPPRFLADLPCPAAWWVPVDCAPLGAQTNAVLRESKMTPVAMSRFGQEVLGKAGFEDVAYVPHAVDTALFCPQPLAVRKQARADHGLGPDTFVIGINAANQHWCRKGWFEQFYAYRTFLLGDETHPAHPDSAILAWTGADGRPQGIALDGLADMLGIADNVVFRDPGDVTSGITTQAEMVTQFYAACDLVSNCAWAEGFGIVPLEAQSCGIPVVTTDFSAMSEVGAPSGWKVPYSPVHAVDHIAAIWGRPQLGKIIEAYEQAWAERGRPMARSVAARQHASAYDHDRVYEQYWEPVLARLLAV